MRDQASIKGCRGAHTFGLTHGLGLALHTRHRLLALFCTGSVRYLNITDLTMILVVHGVDM
jgi:hypothetical protein